MLGGDKIKLGISSCLLGERVRYDGGHQLDRSLTGTLERLVDLVPVCPEMEAGLGVPREPMHLVGGPRRPRLVTIETGIDHTAEVNRWARSRIEQLQGEELSGFIFKSKSPSCSLVAGGIFARAFTGAFPLVPVEEDDRLRDPSLRKDFIERVFVFRRWREMMLGNQERQTS